MGRKTLDLRGYRPTLTEVAGLIGKSSRWISELRAKGVMPEDGATLGEYLDAWISHSTAATGSSIDAHKARLAAAKADQAEMKNAELRGELLPRGGVKSAVQGAFARVRARLLALPNKAAPQVVTLKEVVPIQEKLTELVHEALAELSATQVGVEAQGGDTGDGTAPGSVGGDSPGSGSVVAGPDAAAALDGEPVGGRETRPEPGRKRRAR